MTSRLVEFHYQRRTPYSDAWYMNCTSNEKHVKGIAGKYRISKDDKVNRRVCIVVTLPCAKNGEIDADLLEDAAEMAEKELGEIYSGAFEC